MAFQAKRCEDKSDDCNSNVNVSNLRAQQTLLEKEMEGVFEFLDSFHLLARQLEFVALKVNGSAGGVATAVSSWCSADFGWKRHAGVLQSQSDELMQEAEECREKNLSVKYNLLDLDVKILLFFLDNV